MNRTPFYENHLKFQAKMVEFAGFEMPIEYVGILDEHMSVVNNVGVFDVSHMGEFWVKGENALAYLQKITSNNVAALSIGQAQYTCMPNEKGGIVDDLLVYRYEDMKYMLVVNAANIAKDWEWCTAHNDLGVLLENASNRMAQLAVQGPKAKELLQQLTDYSLDNIPYYHFAVAPFAGVNEVILSNTGYTGAGGFELYFDTNVAQQVWDKLFAVGAAFNLKPVGLGCRDTLRLEMGFCLYGNDLDDETSAIEAGLGWITKFVDNKPFISRAIWQKQKEEGVSRKLVAFELLEKAVPRHGYNLLNEEGAKVGVVTSGTMSPVMKKGIGMGYVAPKMAKVGTILYVEVRGRSKKAIVVKPPFRK